jgi:integrase
MLNLKWHDIDFALGLIYLLRTKNGERRDVPMNTSVTTALKDHPRHPTSDFVFCGADGLPLRNIDKTYKKLLKQTGITDFRFHDLRHTFASRLAMKSIDLNMIRELLGHKSISMTLRYSHLSPGHKKKAVEVLA